MMDWDLLLTFCLFFIFSGNISRITSISDFLKSLLDKNVLITGIVSCQFISNVPTAVLLSKFTNNYTDLLISVNIWSLGTLISSLASLITIKEFLKHEPNKSWYYLGLFTIINLFFMIMILGLTYIIR